TTQRDTSACPTLFVRSSAASIPDVGSNRTRRAEIASNTPAVTTSGQGCTKRDSLASTGTWPGVTAANTAANAKAGNLDMGGDGNEPEVGDEARIYGCARSEQLLRRIGSKGADREVDAVGGQRAERVGARRHEQPALAVDVTACERRRVRDRKRPRMRR